MAVFTWINGNNNNKNKWTLAKVPRIIRYSAVNPIERFLQIELP